MVAEHIPYYWIDDIFVSGILARVVGINHILIQDMYRRVSICCLLVAAGVTGKSISPLPPLIVTAIPTPGTLIS